MSGTDTAAMCPSRFDVIIDGYGYVTARAVDPNLPFRTQQQALAYTPTFLERTNVSGAYSDNQQDFFLTASQNDWSGGEQQRFFHPSDETTRHRYWASSNLDADSMPGQVTLRPATQSVSFAASITAATGTNGTGHILAMSASHLYSVDFAGAVTDLGAHGLSGTISRGSMVAVAPSTNEVFMCSPSTGVRRYDGTSTFSSFSATTVDAIAFHNNSLYGYEVTTATLRVFDTSGSPTTLFQWKDPRGNAVPAISVQLLSFGGSLLILRRISESIGAELWLYDGTGTKRIGQFPANFVGEQVAIADGVIFVGGYLAEDLIVGLRFRPAVYYFNSGQMGLLWKAATAVASIAGASICAYRDGVVFSDETTGNFLFYNVSTGSVSTIGTFTPTSALGSVWLAANAGAFFQIRGTATGYLWPASATVAATSGSLSSSLIDFENALTKQMRGIKVDWEPASSGDGGSVDIAYQIDSLSGSFTTLQTAAVSGTEYTLPAANGRSIAYKVTLNKSTSNLGPVVKRVYVRAAPILQAYRMNQFILDLGGGYSNPVQRRDNTDHNLTGEQMRANLAAAITSQTPITITDITGTYTGVLEPSQCEFDTNRPSQYYARIQIREV